MTEAAKVIYTNPQSREEAMDMVDRLIQQTVETGFNHFWAVETTAGDWKLDTAIIKQRFADAKAGWAVKKAAPEEPEEEAETDTEVDEVSDEESVEVDEDEDEADGGFRVSAAALLAELELEAPGPKPVAVAERSSFSLVTLAPQEMVPRSEALVGSPLEIIPKAIERMNKKHAVIANYGGKCVVMETIPGRIDPTEVELSFQPVTSFIQRYRNQRWETADGHTVRLGQYWIDHRFHRQYERLDLVPNGPAELSNGSEEFPGLVLNLWRGWGVEPAAGDWNRMRQHIDEVLASGNPEFADYIIRWTAWNVQNPGEPAEVALVLRGGKGSGKGVFGRILSRFFRGHSLHLSNPKHLTGQYNAHLQNKLLLWLDEGMWAGDKQAESVLKTMITEDQIFIEPKGVDAFQWKNRLKLFITANAEWVVPMSHDERRYAINTVSDHVAQDPEYFVPLFEEMDNGGIAAMLWDLQEMDLDGWHPRDSIPVTEAMVEQKIASLSGPDQWRLEKLNCGELPGAEAKNPRMATAARLYADVKNNPRCRYLTEKEFGAYLRKTVKCQHKSNGRQWCWIFPPLDEARSAWIAQFGGEWEWDAEGVSDWNAKPNELAASFGLGN